MTSATAWRPRTSDGIGLGAVLAVAAHLLLLAALALSVNWRTQNPTVAVAEMWSEIPEAAAPRAAPPPPPEPAPEVPPQEAPPPPPPPPEVEEPVAEIAQAPQPKPLPKPRKEPKPKPEEKKKDAKPKKAKEPVETFVTAKAAPAKPAPAKPPVSAPAAPAAPTVTSAQREAQRKANLQRMMSDLGGLGQSARSTGPSSSYAGRLIARIIPNIVFNGTARDDATAWVEIRCAPDGRILSRRLLDSSGSPEWDNAVLRGIDKTESLPLDENGRLPDTVQQIGIRPKDR